LSARKFLLSVRAVLGCPICRAADAEKRKTVGAGGRKTDFPVWDWFVTQFVTRTPAGSALYGDPTAFSKVKGYARHWPQAF